MSEKSTNIIASLLLLIMFVSAFSSYLGDSTTFDESSHIPAGYSYLSQKDFRINPEHPPLIKDLAALPLLFLNLNFPSDSDAWNKDVNSQWAFGWELLYNSGNNPEQITFWARLPMVFVLLFLGWFLFNWTKKEFGKEVALLTLTFFSFSPNFLAHGRLVTTDVGITLGVLLATYFWLKFLKNPSKKNVILAGIVFGISMLLKFSVVLVIPLFIIITIIYSLLKRENLLKYLFLSVLVGVIGVIFVILPVYQFHILNYSPERQLSDTITILEPFPMKSLKNLCIWMADKPIIRALGHYFLGLLMAIQRTSFGNTVYFMNMISASGWWYYFPIVYVLKVPLAFHILTLISLLLTIFFIDKPFWIDTFNRLKNCILNHFTEFSMTVFLIIYWATSISGNLNIGLRHILPTFPFTYVLVSLGLISVIKKIKRPVFKKTGILTIALLLSWYIFSSLSSYPYYLSYFNEIASGSNNGYKYVVDSNYDWGQDLKRLAQWLEEKGVKKIKVDYFGGGDLNYSLGDKWERFNPLEGPQKGWLAISVTLLQGGRGNPTPDFNQPALYYKWLDNYEPIARAGKSIFIYHIE
ncbi:MAG: glycosyltransferase family 39 protein [Candidatus Nealsonbacteria bacterium]|nr:MAG: glycosyltransferase family 39 protein [Candidatus Nealsonbacteria bacterium]